MTRLCETYRAWRIAPELTRHGFLWHARKPGNPVVKATNIDALYRKLDERAVEGGRDAE